jgi:hypothetical protein
MTDVLILHRIPGGKPGQILPLTPRLQRHVEAGNAKILPNENPAFGSVESEPAPIEIHNLTGTGHSDADDDLYDDYGLDPED